MTTQHQVNQQQYQDKSQAYLNSQVHAQGIEFQKMQQLIQSHQFQKVFILIIRIVPVKSVSEFFWIEGGKCSQQPVPDREHSTII